MLKFLTALVIFAMIGTAVGSYVDRQEPKPLVFAQRDLVRETALIQTCMADAKAELEKLHTRVDYRKRDLKLACKAITAQDAVSFYR